MQTKTIDQIPLMDGPKQLAGVRRSRDTDATSSNSGKKRKFDHRDHENVVQLESQYTEDQEVVSVSSPESGDHVSSSSCFRNDLSLDLKAELRFETEASMSGNGGFSRETSPSSEICLDSDEIEMESSSKLKNKPAPPPAAATSRRKQSRAARNPSPAEIDDFFSAVEKNEQKRFADKYNYDIVNDVPMEGRYQWVLLKP